MPPEPRRTVFVGNIPYGLSEDVLKDTLGRVGTVVSWRLVLDKETGKPKGFGFAEYLDHDSASSAVRNLNDTEFMGRKLRVDWSNDPDRAQTTSTADNAQASSEAAMNGQGQPGALPELPPGAPLPPGVTAPDQISKTLLTLTPPQLLDIISQMKGLVMSDPAQATALLRSQPQFAYAIFQALLILELVDTSELGRILEQSAQAAATAPPALTPAQPPPMQHAPVQPPQPAPQPPPVQPGYPPQYQQQYPQQHQPYMPTPPMGQPYQQPPPQQYQPPPQPQHQPQPPPGMSPQQLALIQQVMTMPQAQINGLPPDQRDQIMALRSQYATQGF